MVCTFLILILEISMQSINYQVISEIFYSVILFLFILNSYLFFILWLFPAKNL